MSAPPTSARRARGSRERPSPSRIFARRAGLVIGATAVVALLVGYSRGSAGVELGQQGPVVPITAPPEPATGPTTPPVGILEPDVELTEVTFDERLPEDVNFRDVTYDPDRWASVLGVATVTNAATDTDPGAAPRYDAERDWLLDTGSPSQVVQVELVKPTPRSGLIARFQDEDNYLAVVTTGDLKNVELVEVRDGKATSRGFVEHEVTPGTEIGLTAVGNEVTISIDGEPQLLTTFFGSRPAIDDNGLKGPGVGLLVGIGTPQFDNLRFG